MNAKSTTSDEVNLSHPSVRMKGTENNFVPVYCTSPGCSQNMLTHLHCPFCVKTQTFFDPRILKAHYGVKHVDKGIEYAGLKILRCCLCCDMVGLIKGEKKFTTAHWHCFKCQNGFSRRDEALKHYRTHFRRLYSTFQIYVAQDVNSTMQDCEDDLACSQKNITNHVTKDSGISRQILGTPVILRDSETSLMADSFDGQTDFSSSGLMIQRESVQADNQSTIVIIQQSQDNVPTRPAMMEQTEQQMNVVNLEKLVQKLQEDILQLSEQKENLETKLKAEIQYLTRKVKSQEEELQQLRLKISEGFLNASTQAEGSVKIDDLIAQMKEQHEQLLQEQLAQLRRNAYSLLAQDVKQRQFHDSSNASLDSENFLLTENMEQPGFVASTESNTMTGFVIDKDTSICSSQLTSPYFVVSQTTNSQKRKYEDEGGKD